MTIPAGELAANIMRTFTYRIGEVVTTAGFGGPYPVYHNWMWKDPDGVRDAGALPDVAYVTTTWLQTLAGEGGFSTLQVDGWSRAGGEGDALLDPFGYRSVGLLSAVLAFFKGVDGSGLPRYFVPVLDFAIPTAPVPTDRCIVMQRFDGKLGVPQDRRLAPELGVEGLWRTTMTLAFRLQQDSMPADALYV